jgi:hypothetical protein
MVSVNHGHLKEEKALELHQERRGGVGAQPGKERRFSSSTRKREDFMWLYIGAGCCVYNAAFTLQCNVHTRIDHSQ